MFHFFKNIFKTRTRRDLLNEAYQLARTDPEFNQLFKEYATLNTELRKLAHSHLLRGSRNSVLNLLNCIIIRSLDAKNPATALKAWLPKLIQILHLLRPLSQREKCKTRISEALEDLLIEENIRCD